MMKTFDVGKYLVAKVVEVLPKTVVLEIRNKRHGYSLGQVRWFPDWRQYCYKKGEDWYSASCLRELADFLERQNQAHKALRVPNKESDKK